MMWSADGRELGLGWRGSWLLESGQIAQISQTRETEKRARGDEQVMRVVGDQPALQQCGDGAVAGRAADELDARAGDRLAVGDHGQHLERGVRKRHRPRTVQVPLDGRAHLGRSDQPQLVAVPLHRQA